MVINPSIFKAYDIRGIYPDELNEAAAYQIGRAFVVITDARQVVVGRDMRISGPALRAAVVKGILDQGADVLDAGMVSTDQYYFACAQTGLPGIMVTASHNPKNYNGFKMVRRMPYLLSGETGIQELRILVDRQDFPAVAQNGSIQTIDFREAFIQKMLSLIDISAIKPLKVIVDTGNGMVGPILQDVYQYLPVNLIGMYLEPDGNLPNHGLDPLMPENRRTLQERVKTENADVGFGFDGDGDRFFAIDDRGEFVSGDFLTAILGGYLLEKRPGSKIIYDVRASWAVPDSITAAGGVPLIERVGHAFIKRRMADEDAYFAGEVTGHYYFKDFFHADSGLAPSLILLELLSQRNTSLSGLLRALEDRYFITGEINSTVLAPFEKIEDLARRYQNGQQSRQDGITVTFPTWHFNVRASNTEPLLRLNLEATSENEMIQRRDEVLAIIRD